MIALSKDFQEAYPDTGVGLLCLMGVENPRKCPPLDKVKAELENSLRARYADKAAIKEEGVIGLYRYHYKRFKSTYHVLNQVHSISNQGRSIPKVAALVEAMFAAELKNMILTSGHDLDSLEPPLVMDLGREGEGFTMLAGKEAAVKAGDITFRDSEGVAGSIIHGPDRRTMIQPGTKNVLFLAWGVPGLDSGLIQAHLRDIESYLKLISPESRTKELTVVRG